MHHPTRPPNRPDGRRATGDLAAGAAAQSSGSTEGGGAQSSGSSGFPGRGEPDSPSWCGIRARSPVNGLGVFQTRSIFLLSRRASSGYFSDGDSLPGSPLPRRAADGATQTPSPAGQVMLHALQRMAEAGAPRVPGAPGTQRRQQHGPSSSSRPASAAEEMQTEAVGRELRRIGDDFNSLLLLRGTAAGHRRVVIHPNPLPHVHQEPTVLLCVGLLLLLIGRMVYLQGSSSSQDPSQV